MFKTPPRNVFAEVLIGMLIVVALVVGAGFVAEQRIAYAAPTTPEWIEEANFGGGIADSDGGGYIDKYGYFETTNVMEANTAVLNSSVTCANGDVVSTASLVALQSALGVGGTGVIDLTGVAANDFVQYNSGTSKMEPVDNTAAAALENGANVAFLNEGETIAADWVNTANPWAINEGGTGAATAAAARTALDVQQINANLTDLADGTLSKSAVEDSTNWDTAYSDRLKWDGGATGLVAATGRTSLGLGSVAVENAINLTSMTTGTLPAVMVGTGLTDAQVSNTLTASIFVGTGSTSNAVDLGTAEVSGTLGMDSFLVGGNIVVEGSFAIDATSEPDFAYSSKWADDSYDIDYYGSELYQTVNASHKVQVTDLDGVQDREWTITGAGTRYYIHVSATPEVYVSDFDNDIVYVTDTSGTAIRSFGTNGTGNGEFDGVARLVESGGYLWVCDFENNRIQKLTTAGVYVTEIALGVLETPQPTGIEIYDGSAYITGETDGAGLHSIWVYDASTLAFVSRIGTDAAPYEDVEVFDGYVYGLMSAGYLAVYDLTTGNAVDTHNTAPGAGDGYLVDPDGFAFFGNAVWISEETDNNRIQEWDIDIDTTVTITNSSTYADTIVSVEGTVYAQEDLTAADDVIAGDDVVAGGLVSAVETVTGGTGVIAATGNVTASAGDVSAFDDVLAGDDVVASGLVSAVETVTGGTGVTATTGNVTASAGDVVATLGDVVATLGAVSAATTVTAGTDVTAGGVLIAGSGTHTLTNAAGLIDGTKIQDSTVDDDTLLASDDYTVNSLAVTTTLTVTGAVVLDGGADTVAAGATIVHGGSGLLVIDAATNVSTSAATAIAAGSALGQELRLLNIDTYTITVKDAAGTDLGGADIVLGEFDVLDLMWAGTVWLRTGHQDN